MNLGRIIKDSNNEVYLQVEGKPLDRPTYFKIELYASEPKGKMEELSENIILLDLGGGND